MYYNLLRKASIQLKADDDYIDGMKLGTRMPQQLILICMIQKLLYKTLMSVNISEGVRSHVSFA